MSKVRITGDPAEGQQTSKSWSQGYLKKSPASPAIRDPTAHQTRIVVFGDHARTLEGRSESWIVIDQSNRLPRSRKNLRDGGGHIDPLVQSTDDQKTKIGSSKGQQ